MTEKEMHEKVKELESELLRREVAHREVLGRLIKMTNEKNRLEIELVKKDSKIEELKDELRHWIDKDIERDSQD